MADDPRSCELIIPYVRACAWFEADPGIPGLAPGSRGHLEVAFGDLDLAFVEPMLRRRLSRLARGVFHCAQRLAPSGEVRVVFASRHGEADRTLGLLRDLAADMELSPALFSMSVHNAVVGLWSILKGNRAPATALAAGTETFGWGLVEAAGALAAEPGAPVLYLYADDRLPEPWAEGPDEPGLHALGLLLGGPDGARLSFEPRAGAAAPGPQAHHFLAAWGAPQVAQAGWRWHID